MASSIAGLMKAIKQGQSINAAINAPPVGASSSAIGAKAHAAATKAGATAAHDTAGTKKAKSDIQKAAYLSTLITAAKKADSSAQFSMDVEIAAIMAKLNELRTGRSKLEAMAEAARDQAALAEMVRTMSDAIRNVADAKDKATAKIDHI